MMIYVIIQICLYCTVVNLLLRRHSKMVLNNGWGYLITYFVMFPVGFQISKLLEHWLTYINEQASGFDIFFFWLLVSGVLAALFLCIMLFLHGHLIAKYPSCKWLSIVICVFHLSLGLFISVVVQTKIMFALFGYMFITRYMVLLVMLLTFIFIDFLFKKEAFKNEKNT